jgi:carbonic anhydrase
VPLSDTDRAQRDGPPYHPTRKLAGPRLIDDETAAMMGHLDLDVATQPEKEDHFNYRIRISKDPCASEHLSANFRISLFSAERLSRRITLNNLAYMLKRNKDFAALQTAAGTLMPSLPRAMPNVKAVIIGCADMRVDPVHVLGIEPGEAVVMRNIGGRVTPDLLGQLGLLGRIGQVAGEIPGGGGEFHLVVLHHTDCGITRLAGDPAMLTRYFQIQEGELKAKAVTDPRAAVAVDVALLRTIPALPGKWLISGLVYDVATGLVEVIVPPAPIRTA